MANPKKYSREGIDSATKLLITDCYECDAVSHICSGEKGFVSIKLEDVFKEKVQTRLLLANLTEI